MKSRTVGSSRSLMEFDPSAYFDQLLQSLDELEERISKRHDGSQGLGTPQDPPSTCATDPTTRNGRG